MSPNEPSTQLLPGFDFTSHQRDLGLGIGLLVLTIGEASIRYYRLITGSTTLHPDARLVWRPLARAVHNDAALYVAPATDNKTPLFEFLNLLVAATDAYAFSFLLLVGLANGLSALLLYRLFVRHTMWRTGLLAAIGFVLVVPVIKGHYINVRSFAVCAFLLALSSRRAVCCGTAVAVAALFSQYLIVGFPIICWWILAPRGDRRTDTPRTWLIRFAGAAMTLIAVTYGAVFVIWGWPSFIGSLYWTTGVAEQYFTAYGPSVWIGRRAWWKYTLALTTRLWPLLVLAAAGTIAVVTRRVPIGEPSERGNSRSQLLTLIVGTTGLFSAFLLVRPYHTYWLYPLPWLVASAALAVRTAVPGYTLTPAQR